VLRALIERVRFLCLGERPCAPVPRKEEKPKRVWIDAVIAGTRRRMKGRRTQPRFEWAYHDPNDIQTAFWFYAIGGPTRSEGRGAVKKALKLRRLPVGIYLHKLGPA
jgi:hypothetical protein